MVFERQHIALDWCRLIMLLTTRCGSTSIRHALIRQFGKNNRPETVYRYLGPLEYEKIPDDYMVVGLCRNPDDRAQSCFDYYGKRFRENLDGFLDYLIDVPDKDRNIHEQSQFHQVSVAGNVIPTRWIVLETIERDWSALCSDMGWPDVNLEHEHSSGHPRHELTQEQKLLVDRVFFGDRGLWESAKSLQS